MSVLRRSIRPIPSRTFCSVRAERPLTSRRLAGLGGGAQPLERVDAELGVKQPHRLRPDARDAQHVEQTVGDLGAQPLVVLEAAVSLSSASFAASAGPAPGIFGGSPRR